jgi:3D (Asp-Asp-Asp) domain-containing protein
VLQSLWRRVLVTVLAAGGLASVYQVTILDSRYAMRDGGTASAAAPPLAGERMPFEATAYCKGLLTTSGVAAQSGIAAADPAILPVGSVIQIDSADGRYDGVYTVLDTGPSVQGHEIDLYIWSCNEALRFGRQPIHLTAIRLGWNPRAVTPSFVERLFKRPQPEPAPLPARPLPLSP